MRKQFKQTLLDLAQRDDRIVVLLGDVSVYLLEEFRAKYPDRFYNLGICENTMISAAAGLSSQGFRPFVHTIAPFITERSLEQIKLDMCYNQFGANIVSCGASFDYAWDGATHHSYIDLEILRVLPNIEVIQPGSRAELDVLLRSQYHNGKTTYFRLSDYPHTIELPSIEFGKGIVVKDVSSPVTVVTAGPLLGNVLEACSSLNVNLLYFHTLKPIDTALLRRYAHTRFVVIHDAHGLFEAVTDIGGVTATSCALPDEFMSCYGKLSDVRAQAGLDVPTLRKKIEEQLNASR